MGFALVLGAGGTVGLAYHAGVLKALEEEAGLVADDAEVVIGTSAGSVAAAYLRSGWSAAQMWELVNAAPGLPPSPEADRRLDMPDLFVAAFRTPTERVRRAMGSAFVRTRSMVRAPLPVLPAGLGRLFPGGLFEMAEGRRRFDEELPAHWPERLLWLCAVDIVSGRRIVLGRRGAPHLSLARAVMASCAIPGVYPPVRYGRRQLIDGGAHSTTNLDLAAGHEVVIGVVPMGFDRQAPPGPLRALSRGFANQALATEVGRVRRRGANVLLFLPTASEVRRHGLNMMRSGSLLPVAQAAYQSTVRRLSEPRYAEAFAELRRQAADRRRRGSTAPGEAC